MAGKRGGLHSYTVQESQNASMGQVGSVVLNATGTTFTPSSGVIVAITMLADVTFDVLTAENQEKYIQIGHGGYEDSGNELSPSETFPSGVTVYGRWTSVSMNSGGPIICYIG